MSSRQMNHSVVLAEMMRCQDGKWFLGKCGMVINEFPWTLFSVHEIDAEIISGNGLNMFLLL
jgi:hypothetical protein